MRASRIGACILALVLFACSGAGAPAIQSPVGNQVASPTPLGPGPFDAPLANGLRGMITFTSQAPNDLRISVMRADGTHERLVVNTSELDFYPQWSPDGMRIVFRHGLQSSDAGDVYVVNADGTGLRSLTHDPNQRNWNPSWSPDGRWIAFSSARRGMPELYVMHPDGSNVRRVVDGWGEGPLWSPDGKKLLFESRRDDNYEIYIVSANGSGLTRMTSTPQDEAGAVWSPDGRRIAFDSERDTTAKSSSQGHGFEPHRQLYVMNSDGSDVRRISFGLSSDNVRLWLRNGKIVFSSDDCGSVPPASCHSGNFIMDADGSHIERLPMPAGDLDWRLPAT